MELSLSKTFAWVFTVCLIGHAGCGSFQAPSLKLPFTNTDKDDGSPDMTGVKPPQKVVALWTDTTYNTPGKPPTRGLGARLYFYDEDRNPVPVEGSLIVYGYDDSKSSASKREPDRKYIFKPEKLDSHYSESEFGPSYSIWLPWDAVGEPQIKISALPVLTTSSGVVVMGDLTQHVLPGPKLDDVTPTGKQPYDLESDPSTNVVRLTAFDGNVGGPAHTARNAVGDVRLSDQLEMATISTPTVSPNDQLRATSIRLPRAVSQRLIHSTPKDIPRHLIVPRTHTSVSQFVPRYSTQRSQYGSASSNRSMAPRVAPQFQNSVPSPHPMMAANPQAPVRRAGLVGARLRPPTRYGFPRHQAPNLRESQPVYVPPQTQQYPVTAPSVPAWPPGYPSGNSVSTGDSIAP